MYTVVNIGRQCGSGGGEIGRHLADMMGVPCYNKESLKEFVIENGLNKLFIESYGERHSSSLLLSLTTSAFSFGYFDPAQDSPISQKAYLMAFETIRAVARQGPCVIVGRCADFVLKDHANCLNIFIHAPLPVRIKTISERMGISLEEAARYIGKMDRLRKSYYDYYTDKSWGEVDSYHLTLDSSLLGIQSTAQLVYSTFMGDSDPLWSTQRLSQGA